MKVELYKIYEKPGFVEFTVYKFSNDKDSKFYFCNNEDEVLEVFSSDAELEEFVKKNQYTEMYFSIDTWT